MNERDRLIWLIRNALAAYDSEIAKHCTAEEFVADFLLADGIIVPSVKVGQTVWAVRNYSGQKRVVQGKVSEMFFNGNMELVVAVHGVCRGKCGEKVFLTREEAEQALKERERE